NHNAYRVDDLEMCSNLFANIKHNNSSINILGIYRSPTNNEHAFIEQLEQFLKKYKSQLIIVGDINIDVNKNATKSSNAEEYLATMSAAGLMHYSVGPTRVSCNNTHTTSTEIDHCFIRDSNSRQWANELLQWSITDHYAQLVTRQNVIIPKNTAGKVIFTIDYGALNASVAAHNWSNYLEIDNVEQEVNNFTDGLEMLIRNATSIKQLSAKNTVLKEWITPSLLRSIRKRDKLKKQHLNQPYNTQIGRAS